MAARGWVCARGLRKADLIGPLRDDDETRGFYNELGRMVADYVLAHAGRWQNPDLKILGLCLPTSLGDLRVSVVDDWIACSFLYVERAVAHFGEAPWNRLNPHSGKWNFGCGDKAPAATVFGEWRRAVEALAPREG